MIELDVASKDDVAPLRLDNDDHRIRYRVCDAEESNGRSPKLYHLVLFNFANQDRSASEFFLAFLNHLTGEPARVDSRVADTIHDVGDAANVVEVTVRYEQAANLLTPFLEVAGVGQNVINTRSVLFTECETGIKDKYIVAYFDSGHVATDLFNAAERDYGNGISAWGRDRCRGGAGSRRGGVFDALAVAWRRQARVRKFLFGIHRLFLIFISEESPHIFCIGEPLVNV